MERYIVAVSEKDANEMIADIGTFPTPESAQKMADEMELVNDLNEGESLKMYKITIEED